MHHEYLDRYSRKKSIVHSFDARSKIIVSLFFIFFISAWKDYLALVIIMPIVVLGIMLSKIPILFFIKRLATCMPLLFFILFMPFTMAIFILSKAIASLIIMTLLMSTTKFSQLLSALRSFRVPNIFILMLSFFYRYIFIFIETIHQMKNARESRCFEKKQSRNIGVVSNTIGSIIVRSFEQSERVYNAMLSRGYEDE